MQIEVSDLSFRYPRGFRLAISRLEIPAGTAAAVAGPSGCGKTTLLRLLSGIHTPDTGRVQLDGVSVPELSAASRRAFRIGNIGFVFQDFQLINYLDVEENVRLPFRIHPALNWTQATASRLDAVLDNLGLSGKRNHLPGELSQGEMQRVAIGRALVAEPRLVLADEPTGNLDPAGKDRVMRTLFRECRRLGATLVVVTHERELPVDFDQIIDFREFQACDAQ